MVFAEMYANMAYLLRDVEPHDEEGQRLKKQIEAGALSKRKRKQVERNFDSLVDYVFEQEEVDLAPEFSDCLKILHRYRNAAYHRDTVRPDVLGPAVQICFFLCCHLLKHERHVIHEINAAPPSVLEIFGDTPPESSWPGGSFDSATLGRHVADRLLADLRLDHGRIAVVLSEHLLARLAALDRHLNTVGESIPPGKPGAKSTCYSQSTLDELARLHPEAQKQTDVLSQAREARNYIAHEGLRFGIHDERAFGLVDRLGELRRQVQLLANGDNLVSTWSFRLHERDQPLPMGLIDSYGSMIDSWVFEPVWDIVEPSPGA